MSKIRVPARVKPLGGILSELGYRCFLVGGAVRNIARGEKPKDYDLATDAPPEEVMRIFHRTIPTGIKHGTVTVIFKGEQYEVTTFRVEGRYSDSRRPDSVTYTTDIVEDLSRRDFTVNGMAVDVVSGEFIDPFKGMQDLQAGLIRAIGQPRDRFTEDGLRILRAVRFAAQLGFEIEPATLAGITASLETLSSVSQERVRDELVKILEIKKPSRGLRMLDETGILDLVLPEVARCREIGQDIGKPKDVLTHSILSVDGAPEDRLDIRLAALLHDIGKAETVTSDQAGHTAFYGHERVSAERAAEILKRLRFPGAVIKHVTHLIKHHMFAYNSHWSDAAVRRFTSRVGAESVGDLLLLRRADTYGKTGHAVADRSLAELEQRVDGVLHHESALTVSDLAVDGRILHERADIPQNRDMGVVLEFLLESVLQDPQMNETETLVGLARNFYKERITGPRNTMR